MDLDGGDQPKHAADGGIGEVTVFADERADTPLASHRSSAGRH